MAVEPRQSWLSDRLVELGFAFALLTRLPAPRLPSNRTVAVADYVWAFPAVGLTIGSVGAIALSLASVLGLPPSLAALTAIAATALVSGALHEDGLADFWDGIGGGRTRERKLAIMRDSSIGSYGAIALLLTVGARWAALSHLDAAAASSALVLSHTTARGLLALVMEYMRPARRDGLAAAAGGSWARSAAGLAMTAAISFAFASTATALSALLAAAAGLLVMAAIARRYLGGYTGDVLGAAEQTAEALVLVVLAASAPR